VSNETYSRVQVGQDLSDTFPIKNGLKKRLSPLLINFALEFVIRMVQANQDDLNLNGTHQLLVMVRTLIYWVKAYIL
jgi:hypothetical protein